MNYYLKRSLFLATLPLYILFFVVDQAHALTISPVRQTVVLDPGDNEKLELRVLNDTAKDIELLATVDAFQINDETGRAEFGFNRSKALGWVTPAAEKIGIREGEEKIVLFNVDIPAEAEPGSHYLGLFVEEEPDEGTVAIGSKLGSLLFLHVAGEIREDLSREAFFSNKKIYFSEPIGLRLLLKNNGTIHVAPVGSVVLQKPSGRHVATGLIGQNGRIVLPGGLWDSFYEFRGLHWADTGRLEAILSISYGIENQKQIIDRVELWYLPTGLLLVILLFFLVIVSAVLLFKKKVSSGEKTKLIE